MNKYVSNQTTCLLGMLSPGLTVGRNATAVNSMRAAVNNTSAGKADCGIARAGYRVAPGPRLGASS